MRETKPMVSALDAIAYMLTEMANEEGIPSTVSLDLAIIAARVTALADHLNKNQI